jgi:hypothetical protein
VMPKYCPQSRFWLCSIRTRKYQRPLILDRITANHHDFHSMFLIHRNALIINPQAIKARIDEHFPQASWRHRVLKGAVLCGNIARSIVHILGKTQESDRSSIVDSIYGPLISIYALAIVIIKSSATESARVDLEVIQGDR